MQSVDRWGPVGAWSVKLGGEGEQITLAQGIRRAIRIAHDEGECASIESVDAPVRKIFSYPKPKRRGMKIVGFCLDWMAGRSERWPVG